MEVEQYYSRNSSNNSWNKRYIIGDTPWATHSPSPELINIIEEYKISPCKVIEFGCGTGVNAVFLAKRGFSVLGIDISEEAISIAKRFAFEAGVNVEFKVGDILALDESIGRFDFIVDIGCYHHLRQSSLADYYGSILKVSHLRSFYHCQAGNAIEDKNWGPPRVTASELLTENMELFDLIIMRQFHFHDQKLECGPLGWSTLWARKGYKNNNVSSIVQTSNTISQITVQETSLIQRIDRILKKISFSGSIWNLILSCTRKNNAFANLHIAFQAKDRDTAQDIQVNYTRENAFGFWQSDKEIIDVVITNLAVIAVHEILEATLVDGKRMFDPHGLAIFLDSKYAEALTGMKTGF